MTGFQKITVAATAATFLLIGVGGFVRAAGAGLGCPDWPRCFDRWIPPTEVSQLPDHIDAEGFNFALAWIEYLNRLVGVSVGFLILAVAVAAWRAHRRRLGIVLPAFAAALLVAFQGWFGGQVVAYELDPRLVTVHLIVALAIGALLLHLVVAGFDATGDTLPRPHRAAGSWAHRLVALCLGLVVAQVCLGALVRGSLEIVLRADAALDRSLALGRVGAVDEIHKTVGVFVLLSCAALFTVAHALLRDRPGLRRLAQVPVWLSLLQFLAGLGLVSRALPPSLQVTHLVLGSLLFGCLVLAGLLLTPSRAPA